MGNSGKVLDPMEKVLLTESFPATQTVREVLRESSDPKDRRERPVR
tara:strand:- start:524 stop:661 length:138 start_codon:yes stop_codon:yes gene_type:complete